MPSVGNESLTLVDVASRTEGGKQAKAIAEILNQKNQILDDLPFIECNDGMRNISTQRTGIPEATWRKLNSGVGRAKSQTAQISDSCGMLSIYSLVDDKLLQLSRDRAKTLLNESKPFLEGINQQFVEQLIYGTAANPERFPGLVERYNALSAADGGSNAVPSSDNVINGGGAGSTNTSIWVLGFGEDKIHGIYPAGSKAGLNMKDKGVETVLDDANNEYEANRTLFEFDVGLAVRDWRHGVRIANVDVAALTADAGSGADLVNLLIQAVERIEETSGAVIYCNRTIRTLLRLHMANRPNAHLSWEMMAGKKVMTFDECPVRRVDQLLSTEAAVA
jgi:hypothetical protein